MARMRAPLFEALPRDDRRDVLRHLRQGSAPTDPRLAPPLIQYSRTIRGRPVAEVALFTGALLVALVLALLTHDGFQLLHVGTVLLVTLRPILRLDLHWRPAQVQRSVETTEAPFAVSEADVPPAVEVPGSGSIEVGSLRGMFSSEGIATIGALLAPFFPPFAFYLVTRLRKRGSRATRWLFWWAILWSAVWVAGVVANACGAQ